MRDGEYQGYLGTVQDLRYTLTGQLAEWYAGDRSDLRAGAVLGIALALAQLRYGRSVAHEIELARKGAHRRNRQAGLPCSCGTIRACTPLPEPHETHLDAFLGRYGDDEAEDGEYDDEEDAYPE